jgi:hypothetical protein
MTTTFPIDNRNILDECDSISGWTATDGPVLFTADPAPIESTGYLAMQASNAIEDAFTAITSDDYSQGGSLTVWSSDRAALDTLANVGFGIQLGDGTDRVAFAVGSDTVTAFRHDTGPVKWACFILDPANLPTDTALLAGTEANLTLTAITQVGVYFSTVVKSVGGADNVFWDIIRWADPGDDVVMQGGTTAGAAGNGAEAAAVDRSIGNQQAYGVIRELGVGLYGIQGNLTVGNSASASNQFWEETNVTYSWEARNLSDRNYYRFNFVGSILASTSSIIFNTSTLTVATGADARLDANGADLDVVTLNACTLLGWNVGIIGSDDTGDSWAGCTYIGCAAMEAQGCDHTDSSFSDGLVCALIEAQDETSYDDTATEGSFTPGASYAASDTIVMSNGQTITVDTVSTGAVTTFTVTTSEGFPAYVGHTLTQASTSGGGSGFELWPRSANLAEGGSIFYDLAVDPDGELDGISFTKGTADTHAIVFGPNVPATMTLRDCTYSGYSVSNNVASSTLHFLDTSGTITVNIVGGDTPTYKTEGATIVIAASVTVTVNGVAEGTAVSVIANETAGTVTIGDVLGEGLADSTGTFSFSIDYEGAFGAGLDVLIRARNQGLPNFGLSEDNTVFLDQTTAANSSTVDDMFLLVNTSPVAGQDWFYFGHPEQFFQLKLDISTAMAGGAALDFEYWNGAWTNLGGVSDGTSAYTNTGENTISWNDPGDWATTSVDAKGPVYYMRIGYLSGTVSTAPRGRKCKLDVTRYLPIPQSGLLEREITSSGLTATLAQAEDTIAIF